MPNAKCIKFQRTKKTKKMNNIQNVRIRFSKIGSMRFISHLDLNRTMSRAFRRAELPIAYSEGFNPRPKLVFGLNLSIGAESECEILDTRLTEPLPADEILCRLNGVLTDELKAYEVYEPVMPLKTIGFSEYLITVPSEKDITESIKSAFIPPVMILKQTKTTDAVTDISDNIESVDASFSDGIVSIRALLTSGNNNYLNPEYVIKVIAEKAFPEITATDYRIMRKEIYNTEKSVFR